MGVAAPTVHKVGGQERDNRGQRPEKERGHLKSQSIPGPSRESSGTETNGLIRLFKWIIVSSSFQMDSARLTKGPRLHLTVTCAL